MKLCFYRCLSVHTGGGEGVRGFFGGGACVVFLGGHAWFFWGVRCFSGGGMHVFFGGGVCGFFGCIGYNEIRSMSGRYASYWNAFLSEE